MSDSKISSDVGIVTVPTILSILDATCIIDLWKNSRIVITLTASGNLAEPMTPDLLKTYQITL